MVTRTTRSGKYRYWQKSLVVVLVAFALLGAGYSIPDQYEYGNYLVWCSAVVFVIAAWYGIMSLFETIDKNL